MRIELQEQMNDCMTELTDIQSKINQLQPLDKSRVYFTQYALMRAEGTVEVVIKSIVADYFDQFSIPQISTYLDRQVRTGSLSARYENMTKLLGMFDSNWESTFKNSVSNHPDKTRLISSVTSLVNNRHNFAHGKPTTATFNDIMSYYIDATTLIGLFEAAVH